MATVTTSYAEKQELVLNHKYPEITVVSAPLPPLPPALLEEDGILEKPNPQTADDKVTASPEVTRRLALIKKRPALLLMLGNMCSRTL